MCFFKAFFIIKMFVYQYIFLLWTNLICSDLSMRGGIRSNVAVQEVTDGGRGVHHVHSLHVQLEQVLGCTTDQFRYDNGLKMKGCPLDQSTSTNCHLTTLHLVSNCYMVNKIQSNLDSSVKLFLSSDIILKF